MREKKGIIAIAGAGPGHPDLLTSRTLNWLKKADVIAFDEMVSFAVQALFSPEKRRIAIGHYRPKSGQCTQGFEQVPLHREIVSALEAGLRVLYLKGGDAMLCGHLSGELQYLRQLGFPYEIIPGIGLASAAAAFTGAPLAEEHSSLACTLGMKPSPQSALESGPGETRSRLLSPRALASFCSALIDRGLRPDTPALFVASVSESNQRSWLGTLESLPAKVPRHDLEPGIILYGPLVHQSSYLKWFQPAPRLSSLRIWVARSSPGISPLSTRLRRLGAYVDEPVQVKVRALGDAATQLLKQLNSVGRYVLFTTPESVHSLIWSFKLKGRDIRELHAAELFCFTPGTGRALRKYGLSAQLAPSYDIDLTCQWLRWHVEAKPLIVAGSSMRMNVFKDLLGPIVKKVYPLFSYEAQTQKGPIRFLEPDFILFSSPWTVLSLVSVKDLWGWTQWPTIARDLNTLERMREWGAKHVLLASSPDTKGFVKTLLDCKVDFYGSYPWRDRAFRRPGFELE